MLIQGKIAKLSILFVLILVFTVTTTALLSCQAYPTSYGLPHDYVALGDSYSAGQTPYGVTSGYSYTDFIRDKLEAAGILGSYQKTGVSGYRTTDIMNQIRSMKELLYDADIVTMDIGINDILQLTEVYAYYSDSSSGNFDAAQEAAIKQLPQIESNIRAIIKEIKDVNPDVDPNIYIMGYFNAFPNQPEFLPLIERLNTVISSAAAYEGATYVVTMDAIDEKSEEYFPGDIHPTVEAYGAIAEEFWKVMKEDLLTSSSSYEQPNDIDGHWAENNINKYLQQGIITGYDDDSFKPDQAVTRSEFVTIINKYFNLTALTDIAFTDVPGDAWYKKEVQKAVKEGYVSGYDDDSFRGDTCVTRQEAAVMIAKIMKLELSNPDDEAAQFDDGQDIPSWSREAINALVGHGILKGYPDNSIRYNENLTRAEALSVLDNVTVYIDRAY